MQVEAPVKIPDKVPQLAPTKPAGDKKNEKGKKFKLLLFNDNVNRCAPRATTAQALRFFYRPPSSPGIAHTRLRIPHKHSAAHFLRVRVRSTLHPPNNFANKKPSARPGRCRREYVARVLVQNIPEFSQSDAYLVMQKAHKSGMAVVGTWVFECAEAYCAGLKSGGLIASITEED